ncbi:hypothetical protein [Chryseobacterium sp. 2VB]|uniref:hypothetical protein n=1 Tax=Chryseobacterium sp. 2VB TaxID=2502204 RepID=UPI0010F44C9B|nr:hypothetical protein [Chryseobacterium sp. 2VB]
MKLISMTEFVLQENFKTHSRFFPETTIKYAEFLKQPLTLGMFVPVDEEGNVLEEPTQEKYGWYSSCSPEEQSGWMYEEGEAKYYEALEKWNKAKEKVLFEGFGMQPSKHKGLFDLVSKNGTLLLNLNFPTNEDVEWLLTLGFEIELTPSALKQIGL